MEGYAGVKRRASGCTCTRATDEELVGEGAPIELEPVIVREEVRLVVILGHQLLGELRVVFGQVLEEVAACICAMERNRQAAYCQAALLPYGSLRR